MDANNERFENFLREFRPHQPRALPTVVRFPSMRWHRLAAAAVLVIGCSASLWMLSKQRGTPQEAAVNSMREGYPVVPSSDDKLHVKAPSTLALTRLAMEDPKRFEAELTKISSISLPRFDRADSTLRVLAKE